MFRTLFFFLLVSTTNSFQFTTITTLLFKRTNIANELDAFNARITIRFGLKADVSTKSKFTRFTITRCSDDLCNADNALYI